MPRGKSANGELYRTMRAGQVWLCSWQHRQWGIGTSYCLLMPTPRGWAKDGAGIYRWTAYRSRSLMHTHIGLGDTNTYTIEEISDMFAALRRQYPPDPAHWSTTVLNTVKGGKTNVRVEKRWIRCVSYEPVSLEWFAGAQFPEMATGESL